MMIRQSKKRRNLRALIIIGKNFQLQCAKSITVMVRKNFSNTVEKEKKCIRSIIILKDLSTLINNLVLAIYPTGTKTISITLFSSCKLSAILKDNSYILMEYFIFLYQCEVFDISTVLCEILFRATF